MKAITIFQPWASLIMAGAKPYEFRKWAVPTRLIGQRVVIHASTRPIKRKEVADLLNRLEHQAGFGTGLNIGKALDLLEQVWRDPERFPLASGLGTVALGRPERAINLFGAEIGDSDRIDEHIWAWPVREIQHFTPIVPSRGFQGFWEWPYAADQAA